MAADCLVLKLKGLDCAGCAAKIEQSICKLDIVETASVDFINQCATAKLKENVLESSAIEKITQAVVSIDSAVTVVVDDKSEEEETTIKKNIIQYSIGGCFIILSFLTSSELLKISMYMCAYLVFGYEVLIRLVKNLLKGKIFDENFLMGIATIGAIILGEYPEAVGVMLFYNIGEFCQDLAVDKSRRSIKALIGIKPDSANLKTESGLIQVHPQTVDVGSIIAVKPGERVPIDGVITEGTTLIDTSALTGEPVPRKGSVGDKALSGTINVSGLIMVKTTESYQNSTVMKILDMVSNVSSKKAKTEQFITKFSKYYTPAVVFLAVCLSLLPPILLSQPFSMWFQRGLIFLVVSCPCALVLSVPLGYFAGIGACSGKGVLVKGGNYLEALTNARTIVFDKTGTLTKGVFEVNKVEVANGFEQSNLIRIAANIENFSNHPIGKSIVKYYDGDLDPQEVKQFEEVSGYGVKAVFEGESCFLGNYAFMRMQNVSATQYVGAGSVVYVSVNGGYAGFIVVSDEVKEDSARTVETLKKQGIKTAMLTGDKKESADETAKSLGIDIVYSELLPGEKLERLEELIENNAGITVFVGDGINDAPALARADVSIAMGAFGQDAAIEASDIVLMNDNPAGIADAVLIAKNTQRIVWQNIVFALSVKALVLALGVVGLASMWAATFADVGVSLLAVLNSMRKKF